MKGVNAKMNKKIEWTKIIGLAGMALGFAATAISNYATGKEQEKVIEEKVNEALAKKDEGS